MTKPIILCYLKDILKIRLLLLLFIFLVSIPLPAQKNNFLGGGSRTQAAQPPNILWITCEDMSANLACFGDSTVHTPHIDALAAEGVRYTNVYSVAGVCAPSRSAIITGMYPTSIGTHHMRTTSGIRNGKGMPAYHAVVPPVVKCFPEYLRAAGYYCTNNSKTDYQVGDPFSVWDESSNKAHWRKRPNGMPFFSVVNLMVTHESQIWERKGEPLRVDPKQVKVPPLFPDNPVVRKDLARYYDNIMVMDAQMGKIMQELTEDGLLENTIIFFFSDHGAGLPRFKREVYDRGLHAPMIIRFPGKKGAGTTCDELISFIDLAPTALSLSGIPVPGHIQGQAFLGGQKAATERNYIYAARDRLDEQYDMVRAVRDKRYKYIRNYQPDKINYMDVGFRKQMDMMEEILKLNAEGKLNEIQARWFQPKPTEELYDCLNDPFELNNLAENRDFQSILERMRHVHTKWSVETRDKGFLPEREMVEMMWPQGVQPVTADPEIRVISSEKKSKMISLSCASLGASIAYQIDNDERWRLYVGVPLKLPREQAIKAKAIRYGFKESQEVYFKNQ